MKVDQSAQDVLRAARCDGNNLFLTGQIDRKLYQQVAKVLEAAGGKWNRKAGAIVFDGDARDAIDPILLTGEVVRLKQDLGQFDTPPELVRRVIEAAHIEAGMLVLEPSAGLGNIAVAAAQAGGLVQCYEVDPKRVKILKGHGASIASASQQDFLTLEPSPVYDRVVMNPPFARQTDIDHVTHAAKFLRPGGRLVAIMSTGVTFRQDRKASDFRLMVESHGGAISNLPAGSFRIAGTDVSTVLVAFTVDAD